MTMPENNEKEPPKDDETSEQESSEESSNGNNEFPEFDLVTEEVDPDQIEKKEDKGSEGNKKKE